MSALRQALLLTATFVAILVSAGFFVVSEYEGRFDRRARLELQARFDTLAARIGAEGFNAAEHPNFGVERVYFLPDGTASADPVFQRTGFFGDDGADDGPDGPDDGPGPEDRLHLAGPVEGGRLVVSTGLGRQDLVYDAMFQALLVVGVLSVLAAMLVGGLLGLRSQRRMSTVLVTLSRVAGGDLTARVHPKRDRDDLDRLARRVDDTVAQLEVLMRQTREFSASIAHDLKTPLTRLRLRLEGVLSADGPGSDAPEQVRAALEQVDGIIAVFDAFLRIARLEAGASRAGFQPVDLASLAGEVAEIYAAVVEDGGRRLEVEARGPAWVSGDRVLLIQMLANLIENGMRHTPEGTTLTLVAGARELGLADTGPGIPSAERESVTRPSYRLDRSRGLDGAGLGLSLARTIAELHGARLLLSENPRSEAPGLFVRAVFPAGDADIAGL